MGCAEEDVLSSGAAADDDADDDEVEIEPDVFGCSESVAGVKVVVCVDPSQFVSDNEVEEEEDDGGDDDDDNE